jgi:hypothetical protein
VAAASKRFHLKNEDVIFSGSGTPFVQFSKLHGFSLGSLGEAFDGTMAEHLNDRSGRKRVRSVRIPQEEAATSGGWKKEWHGGSQGGRPPDGLHSILG